MNENRPEPKLEYNVRERAAAGTKATFRGVVAFYIAYLGYKLIREPEAAWSVAVGVAFIAAALAFGYYIWRQWHIDVEKARLPETDEQNDTQSDEQTDEETPDE